MKVLITGSNGFIGKNLISRLKTLKSIEIIKMDKNDNITKILDLNPHIDLVYHLAGANRVKSKQEFFYANKDFTSELCQNLSKLSNPPNIIFTSSIQVSRDNNYGISKKEAEEVLTNYSKKNNTQIYIYRLPNVFGKWCKPNYNSFIATFCYNIARDIEISINDSEVTLVYIDDVIESFINIQSIENSKINSSVNFVEIKDKYNKSVKDVAEIIKSFKNDFAKKIPKVNSTFIKKLYSTYLSYIDLNSFSETINPYKDDRGEYAQILNGNQLGQISINTTLPGKTKGNHYHHTKVEKFIVVSGIGEIKMKNIITEEQFKYIVSEEKLEVITIPPGVAHNIKNIGSKTLITVMWANEIYNNLKPDTYKFDV